MISNVKRVSVTLLVALYTFVLMWSSVDRTISWAAKQSESMSRPGPGDSVTVGKGHSVEKFHQNNRRIIENPFVVEPPVLVSWIVLTPQLLHFSTELPDQGRDATRLSGRAPPLSI
jgi:hypothetical protein